MFPMLLLLFLGACSSEEPVQEAPLWLEETVLEEGDALIFTARAYGEDRDKALAELSPSLLNTILERMGLEPEDFSNHPEERDYLQRLILAMLTGEEKQEGLTLLDISSFTDDAGSGWAARLRYDRDTFERDKELLFSYLAGDDRGFDNLLASAGSLYEEGYPFSAYLISLDGGLMGVDRGGILSGYLVGRALERALFFLGETADPLLDGPDKIYLGARRSWPFLAAVPLAPSMERTILWDVYFTQPHKGNETATTHVVLQSDQEGTTLFSFPFPSGEGDGAVSFDLNRKDHDPVFLSAQPFVKELRQALEEELARFNLVSRFPVTRDRSVLRTGVVIADKDVAGKILSTRTTQNAFVDILLEAGYAAEAVDFDLSRIDGRGDADAFRIFNSQWGDKYDIILYGEAGVTGFTQQGEVYQVSAASRLYEVDFFDHQIRSLVQEEQAVTGSEPARLLTSAFFQLGNDLARACLDLNIK